MVDDTYGETEYDDYDEYDDDLDRTDEYGVDRDDTVAVEDRAYVPEEDEGNWTDWLDEGTIGLLLVVGIFLFLFPEPGTSAIGALLIAAGIGGLIVDALN
jgi:hypothetical protein